jgi:hypothetical protein
MKNVVLILGFWLIPLYAQTNIWQGTIGKSEIYFYLPCDLSKKIDEDNYCGDGSYFYLKTLQNIRLGESLPSSKKFTLNLQVKHSLDDNAVPKELFELNYKKGKLIGYWHDKSKDLKISLKPFTPKKILIDSEETFTNFRKKFLKYKRANVEKLAFQKKELVWIEEEHTKEGMFRLGNGFSSPVRNIINPLLDKAQEEDALFHLSCSPRWAYGSGVDNLVNKLTYLSEKLLGYSKMSSYDCGGAHPDFGTTYNLIDLNKGKGYSLEDIIKFQENVPSNKEDNWNERFKYDELVAKTLRKLAFKAEGMKLEEKKDEDIENYDPYELSHWEYMEWSYERKGIRFFLSFSSASRAFRGDSFLIPFKLLEPYKNKNFSYKFGNSKAYMPQK